MYKWRLTGAFSEGIAVIPDGILGTENRIVVVTEDLALLDLGWDGGGGSQSE